MNVDDRSDLDLIRGFARFEFALKRFPEFVNGQPGDLPETQWTAYYPIARRVVAKGTSRPSRDVLLGTHQNDPPPKRMVVVADGTVDFEVAPLHGPTSDRLMDAARRVRNNSAWGKGACAPATLRRA